MALLFDIETDGLLDVLTQLHVLVIKDTTDGHREVYRCDTGHHAAKVLMDTTLRGEYIVAHNGIKFDIPALKKLYPWFAPDERYVLDTLVMTRLIWTDLTELDTKLKAAGIIEGKEFKSHALGAWGKRLKCHKGDFKGPWAIWSQEMEDYCVQDVEVLHVLWDKIQSKNYSQQAIQLEHEVAFIIAAQERWGFVFDQVASHALHVKLVEHRLHLEGQLKEVFKPLYKAGKETVAKVNNKTLGYTKGVAFTKVALLEFNPGSRDHIALWLKRYHNWVPVEFTNDGKAKVDETVLASLDYPEAKVLNEYLMVAKRLGQLAEGDEAWFRHVHTDGRIHGGVITNGAVTGRATHSKPNMGQVPSSDSPYGHECRALFTVPPGKVLVGADLSGLELRCLAHYMARYDDGEYGRILLEGDIHTANQLAAGLPTRSNAKTFIYGFLYGAGDEKIGKIVGKGRAVGKKLRETFLAKTPALGKLVKAVKKAAKERKSLVGLDGRLLHVRSDHAALNTLLQSAGALIAKQALVEFDVMVKQHGWADRVHQVAWVHDEIQVETDEEIANEVGQMAVRAFQLAGEHFRFRIRIDGEYKIGRNWAGTH